ncbi:MAG: tripartite tricarboxylate transporter permease, partial [Clostridia bacterium]|nr:tripartite tricarboxylate transporter permease [Clostridia bacterium]
LTYIVEKRINKKGDAMGTGIPEGIAVSESSNNAASIGAFVPLLSLGIPGSGTAAVLLGGLMMWGLQPGPLFMSKNPELCWSLIASLFIGDILIAILCILLIPFMSNVLKVPNKILVPIVFCVCMLGAYCVNTNIKDLYTMVIAGCFGFIFIKYKLPLAPMVLAMVLGETLEKSIRQGLLMGRGSAKIFFTRPLSLGIFIFGVIFSLLPVFVGIIKKNKEKQNSNGGSQ